MLKGMTKVLSGRISAKKAINYLLVKYSYSVRSSRVYGYPISLRIEPTNICNLRCPLCPTGNNSLKRPKGFMKFTDFKKIIDELYPYLFTLSFWNYGEPLLKEEFYDMIKYAKDKKIHVTTSTNGHFFTSDERVKRLIATGLDVLIVSIDGATQKTYKKYRVGGNLGEVIRGLKRVVELRKRLKSEIPLIQLQFIVMKQNEHEIEMVKKLAQDIGVDSLLFKTVNLDMDYAKKNMSKGKFREYLPKDENFSRYKKEAEIKLNTNIGKLRCPSVYFGSVINWDGTVSPCCWDADSSVNFGNCLKENFMKIWNNPKYVSFRKTLNKNKSTLLLCKECIPNQNLLFA